MRALKRLFSRPPVVSKPLFRLGALEILARSGPAGWILAQEKARLEFVEARETYAGMPSEPNFERLTDALFHLQSTNAIVQALINEQHLERMAAEEFQTPAEIGP